MVLAAAQLLGERGVAGASFSEVLDRSGAPRGSIYHHFPDGKSSLTAEALTLVAGHLSALLARRDTTSPTEVVERFISAWRAVLVRSDCAGGCAIAAVANDPLDDLSLRRRAAEIFTAWQHQLADALTASGLPPPRAPLAAALILAAVEGALILCRAQRSLAPLDTIASALLAFVTT